MQCLIINRRFVLAITTIAAVFFGPEVFAQTPTGTNTAPAAPLATGSGTGNVLNAPIGYFICTTTCTVTPPVPSAGYQFCVMNDDDVNTVITLGALGSSAKYENTARSAYGTAGTGTLADYQELAIGLLDENSWGWRVLPLGAGFGGIWLRG